MNNALVPVINTVKDKKDTIVRTAIIAGGALIGLAVAGTMVLAAFSEADPDVVDNDSDDETDTTDSVETE